MRVRFHIPANSPNVGALQANISAEGNPTEGPTYTEPARSNRATRYQRGGTRRTRSASSEGSEGFSRRRRAEPPEPRPRTRRRTEPAEPPVEPPRRSRKNSRFKRKKSIKKRKVFARSRKIQTKRTIDQNQDFGPFKDIVSISRQGLDIADIARAKSMLNDAGLVPLTFKFFVDTAEIRNHQITSAEILFEKPSSKIELPSYTGTIISPKAMNASFLKAGARGKGNVIETLYINFENVYDMTQDIEYKMTTSPSRFNLTQNISGFSSANITKNIVREPVNIPMAPAEGTPSYAGQYRRFTLGQAPDPGAQINRMPGSMSGINGNILSGFANRAVGTNTFLHVSNMTNLSAGPTGSGLLDNKMSLAASSLTKRITATRTKNMLGFKSRLMPVVVTAAIPSMKYRSSMRIRIRLKSRNNMVDQVVAAGSKIYSVEEKYRACLLPMEPPQIRVTPLGSGLVEIFAKQEDPAGTHVTVFGKFFNKNGSSIGPWDTLKTFTCKKTAIVTLDFSHRDYETAAIRAVSTNGIGYGSKYSASSVKNWRPINISKQDTIIGDVREMPTVVAINAGATVRIHLKNTQACSEITLIREDLNTGKVNRVGSSINNGKESLLKKDGSARIGGTYRYYAVYKTLKSGETQLTSYKDAIYTHKELSPEALGIKVRSEGFNTSTGEGLGLRDDSVEIRLSMSFRQHGLKSIVNLMKNSGIEGIVSSDTATIMKNFDKFFATRTTRINLITGERSILAMTPIDTESNLFSIFDAPDTRKRSFDRISGPVPGGKYLYVTRLYYADIPNLLGSDTSSSTPASSPTIGQSVIKNPSRRFQITANTLRSILPSEEFVGNDSNYGDALKAYERNFTGFEISTEVSIPKSNNFIKNVAIQKVTDQVMTLSWDYGGDSYIIDHFVVCEKSLGKIVPIGAKIAFTTTGKHTFHITSHEPDYDKSYTVKAYDEEGALIAENESSVFIPALPIPDDILKVHNLRSLQNIKAVENISL